MIYIYICLYVCYSFRYIGSKFTIWMFQLINVMNLFNSECVCVCLCVCIYVCVKSIYIQKTVCSYSDSGTMTFATVFAYRNTHIHIYIYIYIHTYRHNKNRNGSTNFHWSEPNKQNSKMETDKTLLAHDLLSSYIMCI